MNNMKKLYIQPQTETAEMMPTAIICVSGGNGGSSDGISGAEIDLP